MTDLRRTSSMQTNIWNLLESFKMRKKHGQCSPVDNNFTKPTVKQVHAKLAHCVPYITEQNQDKHVLTAPLTKSFLLDPITINSGYVTASNSCLMNYSEQINL